MTKTLRLLVALALVVVAGAVAVGCGSGSTGSGTDTAKVAPPDSFFYAEATIDPSGGQQSAMRSILGDLPGSGSPQQRLNNLLEKASKSGNTGVDYRRDVEPWLGDKASLFVAKGAGARGRPAWAVALTTTDTGKANAAIKKGRDRSDRDASYRGTKYLIAKDGTAAGTVGGFVVIGNERGLHDAVDATKGQSLSGSDRFKQAIKSASADRVGLVYEDLSGALQAAASASGRSLGAAAPFLGTLIGGKPTVATVRAENQALVVDGGLMPSGSALGLSAASTPLLGKVPADSWLAAGVANFGQTLKTFVGLVAGALGGEQALSQQLKSATGIDLEQDVISWIGDVALFVNGSSPNTIGGGALIHSTNPDRSRAALTKLAALAAKRQGGGTVSAARVGDASGYRLRMTGGREPVYMLQSGDTVAFTYGAAAARAAFGGGAALANAPAFKNAINKLGDGYSPSLYLSTAPILRLAQASSAHDRSYRQARPYLSALDYLIAGNAGNGNASRLRIGFRPHG